ncbi:hypothetical protein [Morganella morganii]|uniref:hypothetical protein n=1 Tax=Morganella morganii TaxID=582 RepID=UPI001BD9F573|nr:hypothetical protein [Morganella morganii]MBT0381764.1 hypothetical protein [Morganella morganii subsp. morganii]HDT1128044.1 hypothetical protein [Morganella morganii subsp. morganii]HDU8609003.1 hypothetical protein [Morganella morganii]
MENYFLNLETIHPSRLAEILLENKPFKSGEIWEFTNEIKPLDLYCYLYAKYGPPNGIQNFLRSDDSDNLIHWEWTLAGKYGFTSIQGHNFRSEVHLLGDFKNKEIILKDFISQIKSDIVHYGKKISEIRKELEKWTQFVNPYKRIESAVNLHFYKLNELNLNPQKDKVLQPTSYEDFKTYQERWSAISEKYIYAVGLAFGLRSMLPVLAESFVNLLLFVLCRSDIKSNDRLFNNTIRQQIDIRIQSLHVNCIGFNSAIDYSSEECRKFHTLMNERNDLLHGNVEVNKLSIGDVFFNKRVPLFIQYEDIWDKSIGVSMQSVKFETIHEDKKTIDNFIKYILDKLDDNIKKQLEIIMDSSQLGFNNKTGRIGLLFPEHMVDFRAVFEKK